MKLTPKYIKCIMDNDTIGSFSISARVLNEEKYQSKQSHLSDTLEWHFNDKKEAPTIKMESNIETIK